MLYIYSISTAKPNAMLQDHILHLTSYTTDFSLAPAGPATAPKPSAPAASSLSAANSALQERCRRYRASSKEPCDAHWGTIGFRCRIRRAISPASPRTTSVGRDPSPVELRIFQAFSTEPRHLRLGLCKLFQNFFNQAWFACPAPPARTDGSIS